MAGITVILTTYRRPEALAPQVEAIRAQSVPIREIWAWANEPDAIMKRELERAQLDRVVVSTRNAFVHARFSLALLAPTEFVAIFDDDTLPGEGWLENCLETFERTPGILGSAGVRLHDETYSTRSIHGWHSPSDQAVEVDLVGHAWFLKTAWVQHLFSCPPVTGTNGEDIELCARAWRIAGIRSFCPPHPPRDRRRWGSLAGIELGNDQVALSRRPGHLEERDRIVKAEIQAGWLPCFRRVDGTSNGRVAPRTSAPALAEPVEASSFLERGGQDSRKLMIIGFDVEASLEALGNREFERLVKVELDARTRFGLDSLFENGVPVELDGEALDEPERSFDTIVCDRGLEQSRDPLGFLGRLRRLLEPDGRLICRISNTRRHEVVNALLSGSWKGADGAPRGGQPIRFFTRREVEKLLFRAGFRLDALSLVPGPDYESWRAHGRTREVRIGSLGIDGTSPEDAEEFFVHDLIIEASPEPASEPGLTSIVIAVHNQLSFTLECLESIRKHTFEPYELIVVDNASTDETIEYLKAQEDVQLIENAENLGFPKAVNQGIRAARGGQVLLLNNDCVVTTGWLTRMLRALREDPTIGLVGPCSNRVSGAQQIDAQYETGAALDAFAWEWGKEHDRVRENTDRLIGFCLLIRREVIDRIGVLDERFGIGCFEDDDYTLRAIKAGFRALIAFDAFVHHVGGVTFVGSGVDFAALMIKNEQIFRRKWEGMQATAEGGVLSNGQAVEGPLVEVAEGGGLLLKRKPLVLSLCMIVRNSAKTLRACLESVKPWVDEMIVVDTGSTSDDTLEIAGSLGARVFHFPWPDSFSIARNESIRYARGRWIFWMDSDDTLDPDCGSRLRELAYRNHDGSILGFVMQVQCPGLDGDMTVVDHVKLFRNLPQLRFENRIHEQILPSIRRLGGEVAWTELFVRHSGSDPGPEAQDRKRERDLRLLGMEEGERPNHPFTLFNLGMTYSDAGDHAKAQQYLVRCLEQSRDGESHIRKAYALLVFSLMGLRRLKEAEAMCKKGLDAYPLDDELRFRMGILLHDGGRLAEASIFYEDLFKRHEERHFTSVDPGIRASKAHQNLAVLYHEMGDIHAAERHWRALLDERPGDPVGMRGLEEVAATWRKRSRRDAAEPRKQAVRKNLVGSKAEEAEICKT